ncbi:CPBP family intramembrane metalloprotease [Paenibacillus glycanilyticus]|uniref:CPBP family intramembrane glutamic endopeptidase n=1 Tax=Paenibacillus glycanilyticus TaxID=126569 RepID=UPI00203F6C8C|nr:CPBP family intramembrane glutamic endopeptidase [Paenibacillus glycanilyticus]MCM3631647.1 CPBP family intramembrane metalloprotease [Paenibacillus glycanilyticus]
MNLIKKFLTVAGKLILSGLLPIGVMIIVGIGYSIYAIATGASLDEISKVGGARWTQYLQTALFIGSALVMYTWFERKRGWPLGLMQKKGFSFGVQGFFAGILLMTISAILIRAAGGLSWKASEWDQSLIISLFEGILLYTCVALSEEIFTRGYIQGLIKFHYGSTPAIIVSSIIFASMHSMNPNMYETPFPFINICLAGILFAVTRELTGGLWWPIGLHLSWNYFQGYVYGFQVSGTDPVPAVLQVTDNGPIHLSGGEFGAEGSYMASLVLMLGIIAVYYLYRGKNKSNILKR